MVRLNDKQEQALSAFEFWAQQRYVLNQQFEAEMERRRTEFFAAYESRGYAVVQDVVAQAIPKRRLGAAYGSSDKRTVDALLDKYAGASVVVAPTPQQAPQKNEPLWDLTDDLHLTVQNWPSEVHPGETLNFAGVELKPSGLLQTPISDDRLPLNHELVNRTTLQGLVQSRLKEVNA